MKPNRILTVLVIVLAAGLVFSLGALTSERADAQASAIIYKRIGWDYDSGWQSISPGQLLALSHGLGGEPGEYFV